MERIIERKQAKVEIRKQNKFLEDVLESLTHPFYVINADDYTIKMANSAAQLGDLTEKSTCYALAHKRSKPCGSQECPCPVEEIRKTKKPVSIEHIHHDKDGNHIYVEVHAYPLFDSEGNLAEVINYTLDITERKKAGETLIESEKRYRKMVDAVTAYTYSVETNGGKVVSTQHSPGSLAITGYIPEDYESDPNLWHSMIYPEDQEIVRYQVARALAGEDVPAIDHRIIHRDGTVRWVRDTIALLRDSSGRVIHYDGLVEDITERKLAEEALQQSENKYRTLLENLPQRIFLKDRNLVYISCNENYARDLKINPGEIAGKTDFDFYPKELAEKYREDDRYIIESEKTKDIEESYILEGQEMIVHKLKTPVKDEKGNVIGILSIFWDITERKRAEQRQELSDKILECLNNPGGRTDTIHETLKLIKHYTGFEAVGIRLREGENFPYYCSQGFPEEFIDAEKYLCARNHKNKIIRDSKGNPVLECMCGSVLMGRTNPSLPFFTEGGSFWTNSTTQLLANTAIEDRQTRTRNRCNGEGYESVALIPLRNEEETMGLLQLNDSRPNLFTPGMIRFYEKLGYSIGITLAKRKTEEEKSRLEGQLVVAQKMESLGVLAGEVAHDLNNILSGLVSYPELLKMQIDGIIGTLEKKNPLRKKLSGMKKFVNKIESSGNRAADVVQNLSTMARRGVSMMTVLNLNDIVSEYLISPEFGNLKTLHPGVLFETNLESGLINISGSAVHLSKTLMNLVNNAAEALPGGGKVTITTTNRYIDQPIRGYESVQEGDYAVLTVADNGIGIPSEELPRIFEPFYTRKVMGRSGSGLGMAVVWGTVKDHKGYIDVNSIKGEDSIFNLYFPITRGKIEQEKTSVPVENYMGHGETILLVDDVKEQRQIASQLLAKLDYNVKTVPSGEEAIEYLKTNSADLVILDMIMSPGIDGFETYKGILETHPDQKGIIASGFAESAQVKAAQKLGAGEYLKKPYTLEKIGTAVKNELNRF